MPLETIRGHKGRIAGAAVAAVVLIIVVGATSMHISPLSWGWYRPYDTRGEIALAGYDPVAYHTTGAATLGLESVSCEWSGVTWQFASTGHRELFLTDPDRFAPQFGGHCAKAVTSGFTAETDPQVWHIADGKLYVFAASDVRDEWVAAIPQGSLSQAEANWNGR